MSFYSTRGHPWDPGYDIPRYVRAEPQGRGTFTTKQLPRGTFGPMPADRQVWNRTQWTLPDNVKAEPIGRGTFTTSMIPRRTVGALAPDFFGRPKEITGPHVPGAGAVVATGLGSLGGCSLGDLAPQRAPAGKDPILAFGKNSAARIMRDLRWLPAAQRPLALKAALDLISPGLSSEVEKKVVAYKAKGHSASSSLERAIAASLANNLAEEFVRLGKNSAPSVFSALGALTYDHRATATRFDREIDGRLYTGTVSADGTIVARAASFRTPTTTTNLQVGTKTVPVVSQAFGWKELRKRVGPLVSRKFESAIFWSDSVNGSTAPLDQRAFLSSRVTGGHNIGSYDSKNSFYIKLYIGNTPITTLQELSKVTRAEVVIHKEAPDAGFWGGALDVVNVLGLGIPKAAIPVVGGIVNGVKGAACAVASSEIGQTAAVGVATVYGGPAGGAAAGVGTRVAANACAGGSGAAPPSTIEEPSPFPILPVVALAAGGLILLLALK